VRSGGGERCQRPMQARLLLRGEATASWAAAGRRCFHDPLRQGWEGLDHGGGTKDESWKQLLRRENEAGEVADFHSLRHSYVSRLVRAGVNPKVAQRLARHRTAELTLSRYAHADAADGAKAIERVPSLVVGPSAGSELAPRMSAPALPKPSPTALNGHERVESVVRATSRDRWRKRPSVAPWRHRAPSSGGGCRIRTREGLSPLTVFKTVAFVHSANPPSGVSDGRSLVGAPGRLTGKLR